MSDILRFLKDKDPTLLGATVMSTADIHTRLLGLKSRLQLQPHAKGSGLGGDTALGILSLTLIESRPQLYFVKADVKACFDTINQEKLLRLLQKMLDSVSF